MTHHLKGLLFHFGHFIQESFIEASSLISEAWFYSKHLLDLDAGIGLDSIKLFPCWDLQLMCKFFELSKDLKQKMINYIGDLLSYFFYQSLWRVPLTLNSFLNFNSQNLRIQEVWWIDTLVLNDLFFQFVIELLLKEFKLKVGHVLLMLIKYLFQLSSQEPFLIWNLISIVGHNIFQLWCKILH